MPADRLLHPRAGHSQKVTSLSGDEYRVWTQYLLSADDFGVMRLSSVPLRADNDFLEILSDKLVERMLLRVIEVGLARRFQHQGKSYVYQHDWQDYQKVKWPTRTINPAPPEEQLADCSDRTRLLFSVHPGGSGAKVPRHLDEAAAPEPGSRVSERDVEGLLARALPSVLGPGTQVKTQVRLGNSYADIVATLADDAVVVVEVKKHPITKATIAQVRRYVSTLQAQHQVVVPMVVGFSGWDKDADTTGVCVVTYDEGFTCTVGISHPKLRYLPNQFSLIHKTELTTGERTTNNANASDDTGGFAMDAVARELVNLYPASGRCGWNMVERPLFTVLTADPDVQPAAAWDALKARLEQQKRSEQWLTKRMVPRLDRWLRDGLHLQELQPAADTVTPDAEPDAAKQRYGSMRFGK